MIQHSGIVETIADGRMTIAVNLGGCASCGHGDSCGMARLARRQSDARMEFPASDGLRTGDAVTLSMPESTGGLFALLGYLLPALALCIGAALGDFIGNGSNFTAAIGAIAGLLIALLAMLVLNGRLPSPSIVLNSQPVSPTSKGVSP